MASVQSKPAQVNGVDKVSFLDLPPEIRNAVYELCLVHSDDTQLPGMPIIRPGLAEFGSPWPQTRLPWRPQLLVVCRQIYQEAMPVLYGNTLFNAFGRHKLSGAKSCVRQREALKHVRRVSITRLTNQAEYSKLLQQLISMPSLTEVQIENDFRANFQTPRTMARALLPLLEKLNSQPENAKGNRSVHKVVFPRTTGAWHVPQSFVNEVQNLLRAAMT